MEKLIGLLSCDEFGGAGVFILTLDGGPRVQLVGPLDEQLVGRRVVVRARRNPQAFGFGMVGDIYEVVEAHPA